MNTVPSWKTFKASLADASEIEGASYAVVRLLKPSKYPSWGLITDSFKVSIALPNEFGKALSAHAIKHRCIKMRIEITEGRPVMVMEAEPLPKLFGEALCGWYEIFEYEKWVSLEIIGANALPRDGANSGNALANTQSLAEFMNSGGFCLTTDDSSAAVKKSKKPS
jgi:hypothetical protein